MDTARVDICYRPLRIAWAIRADDFEAFRCAARLSFALWGGRFNPIVVVDQEEQARSLVDLFRVDFILPIGTSDAVRSFAKGFPYLINPFFNEHVFVDDLEGGARSQVLDIHNALVHLQETPGWKGVKAQGVRLYAWAADDPLADVLLMQLGQYPATTEVPIHYRDLLRRAAETAEVTIDPASGLPADIFDHPSISFVSGCGLQRHHGVRAGRDSPGFYSGDARNLDDLICFWNLGAADIPLLFIDPTHIERYGQTVAAWDKAMRDAMSRRRQEFDRKPAVWVRDDVVDEKKHARCDAEVLRPFGDQTLPVIRVNTHRWADSKIRPPVVHFGEVSTLGVMGTDAGRPKVSFALDSKPFDDDPWFHTQGLVASLSFIGGLYGDEQHTLAPPYIPELN